VVLTFQMTEMMVVMTETKARGVPPSSKALWLRRFVRSGAFSKHRVGLYLVWGSPLFIILYLEDSSAFTKIVCSVPVVHRISTLHTVQFVLSMGLSVLMSFKLSQAVDNYGLRKSFQTSNRLLMLLAVVDLPLLIFSPDSWVELGYSLDLLLAIAMSHAFIVIHVVLPLTNDAYGMGLGSHTGTFQGTMAILDEYLRTPNGVLYFRTQAPGCLGVDEIYQQHFAPFSLETIVPDNIRTRYSKAFQANDKYAVNPKSLSLNWNYYDVLQDSVATFMVTDLLPRFQKHELGAGWTDFVARHHTEHVLEVMLQNEAMYTFPDETLIKTKKNRLSLIESQQDSIKAQSINGNKNQKKKQPLESIKTASRLGKLVSIPSEKDSVDTPRPGT
ncbi:hypothetical protein DYB30_013416, partial [Aphanomyces astaci]